MGSGVGFRFGNCEERELRERGVWANFQNGVWAVLYTEKFKMKFSELIFFFSKLRKLGEIISSLNQISNFEFLVRLAVLTVGEKKKTYFNRQTG